MTPDREAAIEAIKNLPANAGILHLWSPDLQMWLRGHNLSTDDLKALADAAKQEDATMQEPQASQSRVEALETALREAVEVIHDLHGDVAWGIYRDNSPEMKRIKAALR